jgi:Protein of unknown function (DUF3631)
MTPAQQRQLCEWFAAIGGGDKDAKKNIKALIAKLKKTWNDLPDIVQPSGAPRSGLAPWMALPRARARKHGEQRNAIRARFGSMGSNFETESDEAEKALKTYLVAVGLMWDDLPWLIQPDPDPKQASSTSTSTSTPMQHPFTAPDAPPPCAVLARLIAAQAEQPDKPQGYVAATSHQALAVALWSMHTDPKIFRRYLYTPRLFLTSPVHFCGKTTLTFILERLVMRGSRHENITTAAFYRKIDENPDTTFVLDEGESLDSESMSYVLNSNYQGATVTRTTQGQPKDFSIFAPIAFAAIGTVTFRPSTLSKSIKITLQRKKRGTKLRKYNPNDTRDLDMALAYACEWIERERENISTDPPMPENLDSRVLDNWRPLIAIADASGMGEEARAAMLALSADSEPGINVMALADIRIVFDRAGDDLIVDTQWGDVIPTEKLLKQLHTLDEADGRWRYYCGPKGKSAPRKLTDRALADLLKGFENCKPDRYWPRGGGKKFRGYAKSSFTAAWDAYCPRDEQPTAPLRLVVSRDDDDVS